jgi:IS5 family transposase
MASYKLLVRLFGEQCVTETNEADILVVIKPNKEVPSDSLQNPSDPDASYCGHKGKGYQVQIMETYSPDKKQPDLITHVSVEAAHESDANALLPALEDTKERNLAPTELLADSLYGGDENIETAKEMGVEVVAPAMGTREQSIVTLADFQFSETDETTVCPAGYPPQKIKVGKKGGLIVHFDKTVCDSCPKQSACPVKRQKNRCTLSYDAKSLRLARRRRQEQTPEFKEQYRYRAGVEATMSDLDRVTGLKHLRVRGMTQVRVAATLKATGLNIRRAAAFRSRGRRHKSRTRLPISNLFQHFFMFKTHLQSVPKHLKAFANYFHFSSDYLVTAA